MSQQFQGRAMITSEDTTPASESEIRSASIAAGRALSETVRTTLGPEGMDKMLVDSMGDVVVTNDGITILSKMDIEHPTAQLVREAAETLEDDVGDGTTSAVTVTGELLKRSEELLEQNVHATELARGYREAIEQARTTLDENSVAITDDDTDILADVAATAMGGTSVGGVEDILADLVVRAALSIADAGEIDTEHVNVEKVGGGTVTDSELIEGVVIGKERVNTEMPAQISNARVAVLQTGLEANETSVDAEVSASNPEQLAAFRADEESQLEEMVSHLTDLEVDVVFVRRGIADHAEHRLAREGIMAVRRCKLSDLEKVRRATGADTAGGIDLLTEEDLGFAGMVAQKDIGHDDRIYIEELADTKAVTLVLRGGTDHTVDELERAIENGLGAVRTALDDGKVVPGGGATEVELALELRQYADSVDGRKQLAVKEFAAAMEVIPRTLAENAGANPIDTLVELCTRHDGGEAVVGLDASTGAAADMMDAGVVEPLRVKSQILDSAAESAVMILRIDDVVPATSLSDDGASEMNEESSQ